MTKAAGEPLNILDGVPRRTHWARASHGKIQVPEEEEGARGKAQGKGSP